MKKKGMVLFLSAVLLLMPACNGFTISSSDPVIHSSSLGEIKWEYAYSMEEFERLEGVLSVEEQKISSEVKEQIGYIDDGRLLLYQIEYQVDDNQALAYILLPSDYLEKQYPVMFFNRYGGMKYGVDHLPANLFSFATNGYISIGVQYRGSPGTVGKDEYGGAEVDDILKMMDYVTKLGFVDLEQIFMFGISRGGMMTYLALQKDEKKIIKAAAVSSAISDAALTWEEWKNNTLYMTTCIGGTPTNRLDEYENRSAIYFADEIYAPLLLFHAEGDTMISVEQSKMMAEALEKAGKEYELYLVDDTTHSYFDHRLLEWFEKHDAVIPE